MVQTKAAGPSKKKTIPFMQCTSTFEQIFIDSDFSTFIVFIRLISGSDPFVHCYWDRTDSYLGCQIRH